LVYEEASIASITLANANQTLPFTHRLVIVRNLSKLNFRFYGWISSESRAAAMSMDSALVPSWHATFDGLIGASHPEKLAIEMGANSWIIDVPATADMISARMGDDS
jgi:hypothetical protein